MVEIQSEQPQMRPCRSRKLRLRQQGKLTREQIESEQPRIRSRRSRKLRLEASFNQKEWAQQIATLPKQNEEINMEIITPPLSEPDLHEVIKTLMDEKREMEAENQMLNEALQSQLHEFQQASRDFHSRELMLLDKYDKLKAENELLASQFHVRDIFAKPTGAGPSEAAVVARSRSEPAPSPPSHLIQDSSSLPGEFFCPITWEVMTDPVLAADGHTYELEAIIQWFANGHRTSPMTKQKLECFLLMPNRTLRAQIMAANTGRKSRDRSEDDAPVDE